MHGRVQVMSPRELSIRGIKGELWRGRRWGSRIGEGGAKEHRL